MSDPKHPGGKPLDVELEEALEEALEEDLTAKETNGKKYKAKRSRAKNPVEEEEDEEPSPSKPQTAEEQFRHNLHFITPRSNQFRDPTEMNAPDRFELFLLADGEKKCSETLDTRTPNSSVFTFNKEDHTLANMLRSHLLKDPHVIFSGYKIPHPLFATFELRVQTDGEVTPKEALVNCCKGLVSDLEILSREFTKEYELRKMVSGDVNGANK